LKYELLNTYKKEKDEKLLAKVENLDEQLNQEFGKDWLNETIGYSTLSYDNYYESKSAWGVFIADSIKKAADADIGLHATEFAGGMFPVGNITRKEVFNSYPRVFEIGQRKGWKVYKFNIYGWLLSPVIKLIYKYSNSIYLSGVKFKYKKKKNGKLKIKKIFINGKKLKKFRKYSFGVPEGIIKGAMGISKFLTKLLTTKLKETHTYIWEDLNNRIQNKIGPMSNDVLAPDREYVVLEK
jgi:2',3'-cyclic-nucleotide 2'-phosphodiesterase (5'-nucleotidase family)